MFRDELLGAMSPTRNTVVVTTQATRNNKKDLTLPFPRAPQLSTSKCVLTKHQRMTATVEVQRLLFEPPRVRSLQIKTMRSPLP